MAEAREPTFFVYRAPYHFAFKTLHRWRMGNLSQEQMLGIFMDGTQHNSLSAFSSHRLNSCMKTGLHMLVLASIKRSNT